jgi:hypothetical protein
MIQTVNNALKVTVTVPVAVTKSANVNLVEYGFKIPLFTHSTVTLYSHLLTALKLLDSAFGARLVCDSGRIAAKQTAASMSFPDRR